MLISINKHRPIHLVLSSKESSVKGQIIIRLLDLQEGSVFAGALSADTKLTVACTLLRRGEGEA